MKLNKDEGYKLLKRLMNHWIITGYSLENQRDILDDFMGEVGKTVYEEALKWAGGSSLPERKKWLAQDHLANYLEDFEKQYDLEFGHEADEVAHVLFDIVNDLIKPHLDTSLKRTSVEKLVRDKVVKEEYFICSNCEMEGVIFISSDAVKCKKCKKIFDLKGSHDH